MSTSNYENKAILFIDILGFKSLIAEHQSLGPQYIFDNFLQYFSENYHKEYILKDFLATVCPASKKQNADLNYHSFQISDSFIATAELSPVGVVNLINIARYIQLKTLNKGILVRGYLGCGSVYHVGNQIFGPAYQEAYENERNIIFKSFKGPPVIQVSDRLQRIVEVDDCCKEMFNRMIISKDQKMVINPFMFIESIFSDFKNTKKNINIVLEKLLKYDDWIDRSIKLNDEKSCDLETKENIKNKYVFLKSWICDERKKIEKSSELHERLQQSAVNLKK